jgi:hypothetical protein
MPIRWLVISRPNSPPSQPPKPFTSSREMSPLSTQPAEPCRAVPSAIAVVTTGSPERRVYASDINVRGTVEPAAGVGPGASVRSPESGPMPPASLVATPTDSDLFLMGDSGRRNEGCLQLCRLQRRRFSVRRRARCGACRHLVGRGRRQRAPGGVVVSRLRDLMRFQSLYR